VVAAPSSAASSDRLIKAKIRKDALLPHRIERVCTASAAHASAPRQHRRRANHRRCIHKSVRVNHDKQCARDALAQRPDLSRSVILGTTSMFPARFALSPARSSVGIRILRHCLTADLLIFGAVHELLGGPMPGHAWGNGKVTQTKHIGLKTFTDAGAVPRTARG
jgi:hypothetical protein